jgi:hypothetical protein
MGKIRQHIFAICLSIVAILNFFLSLPVFRGSTKDQLRNLLSPVGIGSVHSYFSTPHPWIFTFEVHVRRDDGRFVRRFTPPTKFTSFFSDVFLTEVFNPSTSRTFLDSTCTRLGTALGRGEEDQVDIFLREIRLRSFDKFDLLPSPVIARIEIIRSC